MPINYKINGVPIEDKLEIFADSENISLTESNFSGYANIKKSGSSLGESISSFIPTSAGGYLGGQYAPNYKVNGVAIDCALKGCRPSGQILLATINGIVGTTNIIKYLNRVNEQTWLSDSANSATGIRLSHDPKCVFILMSGGGGSGATLPSGLYRRRGGGSGAGAVYYPAEIPENGYLQISVGFGGQAKAIKSEPPGTEGGDTTLTSSTLGLLATAGHGHGGGNPDYYKDPAGTSQIDRSGILGGESTIHIQTHYITSNATAVPGGYSSGGSNGHGKSQEIPSYTLNHCNPEQTAFTIGGYPSTGNKDLYGGFGGNSWFGQGGDAVYSKQGNDAMGPGAGGASTGDNDYAAGNGGPGICYIYY